MNKFIKNIFNITLITLLVLMPLHISASPLTTPVTVSLDNVTIGRGYISQSGNTMIPLRILSEKLKYNVIWDNKEQTATITKGNTYIKFSIDYHLAKTNDRYIQLSSVPELMNNSVYLPLRVIADTLGLQIGYSNKTAYISTIGEPVNVIPTPSKQVPLNEVPSLFVGNGYERYGLHGIEYRRHLLDTYGMRYQISFAQVIDESQLVLLNLHYNNTENLNFTKLLLNSLVPTKATEIYKIITTQSIIPLTIIKSDGYQVALSAATEGSSLLIAFDGSKNGDYTKVLLAN